MPKAKKSSSKASSQLMGDFEKRKKKLGKTSTPSNATNTSFKARSIALPQQSVNRERTSDVAVSRRNQTLDQLVLQLRHPNANVRKDALAGIKEIHASHPQLGNTSHETVLPNVVRAIADEDAGVRRGLLDLLGAYLPSLSALHAQPYASLLLLHIGSAMSHIYPDVRLDAVKAMDVCMNTFGHLIVTDWQGAMATLDGQSSQRSLTSSSASTAILLTLFDVDKDGPSSQDAKQSVQRATLVDSHTVRILRCYFALLGVSKTTIQANNDDSSSRHSTSASLLATDMSKGALAVVLKSFSTFVELILPSAGGESAHVLSTEHCPVWFLESSLSHESDREWLRESLRGASSERQGSSGNVLTLEKEHSPADRDSFVDATQVAQAFAAIQTLYVNSMEEEQSQKYHGQSHLANSTGANVQLAFFEALAPLMLTTFLEVAPSAFEMNDGVSVSDRRSHSDSVPVRLISIIVGLTLRLWRNVESTSRRQCTMLSKLLVRIAPYFPMPSGERHGGTDTTSKTDVGEESVWLNINLAYCELVSIYATVTAQHPSLSSSSQIGVQLSHVGRFVVDVLRQKRFNSALIGQQHFIALLPTVWLLLSRSGPQPEDKEQDAEEQERKDALFEALLTHWQALPLRDVTKRISLQFIGHLLQLEQCCSYRGRFRVKGDSSSASLSARQNAVVKWLTQSVPRYLWELSDKDQATSEIVFDLLRWIAILAASSAEASAKGDRAWAQAVIKDIQKPLAPYFHFQHPSRGSIQGPYVRAPWPVQQRARALLSYMDPLQPVLRSAAQAVDAWPM